MRKCEVLRKYSAMEENELDMVEGEIIEILQKVNMVFVKLVIKNLY